MSNLAAPGVEKVRLPLPRGARGSVLWFRSALTSNGIKIVDSNRNDVNMWSLKTATTKRQ